jgi:hypothetical protein
LKTFALWLEALTTWWQSRANRRRRETFWLKVPGTNWCVALQQEETDVGLRLMHLPSFETQRVSVRGNLMVLQRLGMIVGEVGEGATGGSRTSHDEQA